MVEEVGFDDLLEGGFGVDAHGFDGVGQERLTFGNIYIGLFGAD